MEPDAAVSVAATLSRRITFASHQNSVPVIRDLTLHNTSEHNFEDLTLELLSDPTFVTPRTWSIDRLRADSDIHITDRDVSLNGQLLSDLTEAIKSDLIFTLRHGDDVLFVERHPVELLARHEWGGIDHMPELLAAFVTPNDPAVDAVLKSASEVLRRAGKPSAIDGYQSRSRKRVWELASAIWSAVCSLELDYALPPASFERSGQKIRLPSMIKESGRATCLDTVLLFAAAFEQAGFNPVVVFTEGHAIVGLWLQPEEFTSVITDEASALRKRIQLKELVMMETTLAAQQRWPAFSVAIDRGARNLAEEVEKSFLLAVDIRRARMQRIRPLPLSGRPAVGVEVEESEPLAGSLEEAPDLPDFDIETGVEREEDEKPETRLARWQRRLLDLSLRNRLLNFKATKKSIKLFCPEPPLLEDKLADGRRIKIVSAPKLSDSAAGRSDEIYLDRTGEHLDDAYARDALERNEVIVDLEKRELEARLVELYRTARSDMQEGGANTLYLALGFLVWRRDDKDERRFRAPLVLVPVILERKSVRSGVRMVLHDDEPRFNTTLLEMLRQDFNLDIRGFDDALPEDEHGVDVWGIWNQVRRDVRDVEGFEVVEDVVLSTFSFAKYLMWKDLVDRTDQLKESSVVRHLIDTPRDPYASDIPFPDPRVLDRDHSPGELFTPLSADSSQLSSVVACARGKNFVLIGPPGTGKSQTIANMIAHNLAEGRTVLFVSEKIAALNVVYRRLRDVGLGEFCLELHSNKAKKLDVLSQLGSAWDAHGDVSRDEWRREAERLKSTRDSLNIFVEHLHRRHRNGLTIYYAMGRIVVDPDTPDIQLNWPSSDVHDVEALDRLHDIAKRIDINANEVGGISEIGFQTVHTEDWSPGWQRELIATARGLAGKARDFEACMGRLIDAAQITIASPSLDQIQSLARLADAITKAHGRNLSYALKIDAIETMECIERGLTLIEDYREAEGQLSCEYSEQAWRQLPIDILSTTWLEAQSTWWPRSMVLRGRVLKELVKVGGALEKPQCWQDLRRLSGMRDLGTEIDHLKPLEAKVPSWSGFSTHVASARSELETARQLRDTIAVIGEDADSLIEIRDSIQRLITDANVLLSPEGAVGRACAAFLEGWRRLEGALQEYSVKAGADARETIVPDPGDAWLDSVIGAADSVVAGEGRLNAWCAWRRTRLEAIDAGLLSLVDALETGLIPAGDTEQALETAYCRWWVDAVVENDDVLRTFVPAEHENRIEEFRGLCQNNWA